jgi:tRNA/rRNA methyltransferase
LIPPDQAARIDVILVSPRNPLNIGAAARAMANFGFHHLSIVAPYAQNWMEAKSAVGAPDLLREAKVYETLAEAVAHCTLILGTGSLDRRRPVQEILDLPEAASKIRESLIQQDAGMRPNHIALVFGSEKHGLTSDDLSWCHAIAVIDTCEAQPSMNLGQAVAVCLYEISRDLSPDVNTASEPTQPEFPRIQASEGFMNGNSSNGNSSAGSASSGQLDRLAALIEEAMEAVNYSTRGMRSANGEALRVLLRRLMPNDADLRRMMGLFRRILWQLDRRNGKL